MNPYNTLLANQVKATVNGEVASREENDRLYPLVAACDKSAIDKMIESNMPLVISKVESFIRCFPGAAYLRDDLQSEGLLGLAKAVNKMAEAGPRENANATGYISYWVHYHLGLVIDNEKANGASQRTIQRKSNDDEPMPHCVAMSQCVGAGGNEYVDFTAYPFADEPSDPMAMSDLRDLIYSCCETEQDRIIVDMREASHTDKEIAAVIDAPVTNTYMLRRAIYARFLAKSGLKGEV